MSEKVSSDKKWEQLYSAESNPVMKKLILRKMKAGVSFAKFKKIYDSYKSTGSQKFKKIYKARLRAC